MNTLTISLVVIIIILLIAIFFNNLEISDLNNQLDVYENVANSELLKKLRDDEYVYVLYANNIHKVQIRDIKIDVHVTNVPKIFEPHEVHLTTDDLKNYLGTKII